MLNRVQHASLSLFVKIHGQKRFVIPNGRAGGILRDKDFSLRFEMTARRQRFLIPNSKFRTDSWKFVLCPPLAW